MQIGRNRKLSFKTMKKIITHFLLLIIAFTSQAQEIQKEDCDCPIPSAEEFSNVCVSIYQKSEAHDPGSGASFSYQEAIWKMSCINSNDSKEVIIKKIQCMWNKYRELFRCYGYPTSIASDSNVIKFSLDTGFTPFIYESIRKNKLDMNFIDPADGKTILDFVQERTIYITNLFPVDVPKLEEYKRIYKLLKDNGAKHAKDL